MHGRLPTLKPFGPSSVVLLRCARTGVRGRCFADAQQLPGARFFPGARLNFAQNLLRYRDDQPALIFRNERGERRQLSCGDLHDTVARVAVWLGACGVGPGDCVRGGTAEHSRGLHRLLATAARGAIWSCCSPDFAPGALLERFGQIAPKILFCVDGYNLRRQDI